MRQVTQLNPITLKGVLRREKACQRWCYPGGHGHVGAIPTAIMVYTSQDNDMQVVSFSVARESFKTMLDRVETDADVTLITRRHAKGAVVVLLDTYNSLLETVHLLRSPANAAHLQRSLEQAGRDELLVHRLIEPDQADAVD
jgi:antitoxin YefM